MQVLTAYIAVFSIATGFVLGTIPELTIPDPVTEVIDPCIRDLPECSLVKLLSESSWDIGQLLGIQYISYGDFWKLLGCTCKALTDTTGILKCGLLNVKILNNCPCYGCIPLDTK